MAFLSPGSSLRHDIQICKIQLYRNSPLKELHRNDDSDPSLIPYKNADPSLKRSSFHADAGSGSETWMRTGQIFLQTEPQTFHLTIFYRSRILIKSDESDNTWAG